MPSVTVVGSYNLDLFFSTDVLPAPGETRMGRLSQAHGGKGFNQAVACRRLGTDTLFVAALGDDTAADGARRYARSQHLECRWSTTDAPTGTAVIVRDKAGRNQIVVAAGANFRLQPGDVSAVAAEIRGSRVLLAQLECPIPTVRQALAQAREAEVLTILNPAPAPDRFDPDLLRLADILTPNETEFESLCRQAGMQLANDWLQQPDLDLHERCRELCCATVVITLGDRGGFFSESAGRFGRYSTPEVRAIDSTGAGDAFNGALAAALSEGRTLDKALSLAASAAAFSVTRSGAAPSMPDRQEAGWPSSESVTG